MKIQVKKPCICCSAATGSLTSASLLHTGPLSRSPDQTKSPLRQDTIIASLRVSVTTTDSRVKTEKRSESSVVASLRVSMSTTDSRVKTETEKRSESLVVASLWDRRHRKTVRIVSHHFSARVHIKYHRLLYEDRKTVRIVSRCFSVRQET